MYSGKDYSTQRGAEELAQKIKNYWKDRGKDVKVWPEAIADIVTAKYYKIKSNLVKGLPKGKEWLMPVTFTDKQIREHFYTNGNDDVRWSYIEDCNFLDVDEDLGGQIYNILINGDKVV